MSLAVGLIACLFAFRSEGSGRSAESPGAGPERVAAARRVLGPDVARAASTPHPNVKHVRLFSIGRSVNGNRVAYDVAIRPDGSFDTDQPINVYWLLEKGGIEPLTSLERSKAYGAKVEAATPEAVRFTIKPLPTRVIDVRREGGEIRATTSIAGEPAVIEDIFVEAGGGILPKVDYVELKGRSLRDGKERIERIVP